MAFGNRLGVLPNMLFDTKPKNVAADKSKILHRPVPLKAGADTTTTPKASVDPRRFASNLLQNLDLKLKPGAFVKNQS
jgi:hypothetical protein